MKKSFNEWLDLQPIDPAVAGLAREAHELWDRDGGETPLAEWAAYAAPKCGFARQNAAAAAKAVEGLHARYRRETAVAAPVAAPSLPSLLDWAATQMLGNQVCSRLDTAFTFWVVTGEGDIEGWVPAALASHGLPYEARQAAGAVLVETVARYRALGGVVTRPADIARLCGQSTPRAFAEMAREYASHHLADEHFARLLSAFGRTAFDIRSGERNLAAGGRVWATVKVVEVSLSQPMMDGDHFLGEYIGGQSVRRWMPGPDAASVTVEDVQAESARIQAEEAARQAEEEAARRQAEDHYRREVEQGDAARGIGARRPLWDPREVRRLRRNPDWCAEQARVVCPALLAELNALGDPVSEWSGEIIGAVRSAILRDMAELQPVATPVSAPATVVPAVTAPAAPFNGLDLSGLIGGAR